MYQHTYFKQQKNIPTVRYLIDYNGYSEGWATYVEWNGANYSLYNTEVGSYIGVADVDFGDDGASMVSMKLSDTSMTEYKECVAALNKKVTGKHTVYFVFEKTNVLTDSWKFNK